jgi:hypothetical protein
MYKLFIVSGIIIVIIVVGLISLIFQSEKGDYQIVQHQQQQHNLELITNLKGDWKFSIGDSSLWSDPLYNADSWDKIYVPGAWEDQGFHGYDGYAWYRRSFEIPLKKGNGVYYLYLGYVDDVEEVFFNGTKIGFTGSMPPYYITAYNAERLYVIPNNLINFGGMNHTAVRVYDAMHQGGIIGGNTGVYYNKELQAPELDLTGEWKFKAGDDIEWKDPDFNDKEWENLFVPGLWDYQGYSDYDGYGWYRKEFEAPDEFLNSDLILLMGKIDDYDKVYINGKLIGVTGEHWGNERNSDLGNTYLEFREYKIQRGLLKSKNNLIAVKVYDAFREGGIYQGPVGFVKDISK